MEIWKEINGYNGQYLVSNYGRVKSFMFVKSKRAYREFILKPSLSNKGYHRYGFKGRLLVVHRLVAKAFILNPENKPEINHKDGNKVNNHVDNLEWCTRCENERHAWDTGIKQAMKGEKHPSSKTSDVIRNGMINMYRQGARMCEIGEHYGFHDDYVIKIIKKSGFYEKRPRVLKFTGDVLRTYQRNYQAMWRRRKKLKLEHEPNTDNNGPESKDH